jgi:hypothetical protein
MLYLAHWAVCLQEVGLQVDIKQVASDTLNGVIDGQHVDTLAILDIRALQQWTATIKPSNKVSKTFAGYSNRHAWTDGETGPQQSLQASLRSNK